MKCSFLRASDYKAGPFVLSAHLLKYFELSYLSLKSIRLTQLLEMNKINGLILIHRYFVGSYLNHSKPKAHIVHLWSPIYYFV